MKTPVCVRRKPLVRRIRDAKPIKVGDLRGERKDGKVLIDGTVSIPPTLKVSKQIEALITAAEKARKGDRIDHIMLSQEWLVYLFYEGKVPRNVIERPERVGFWGFVIRFNFNGTERRFVIKPKHHLTDHVILHDRGDQTV